MDQLSSHRPRVGIGVMIVNNGTVLMGKRKNAHGAHTWSFPGGHLEFKETFEQCAQREVLEEVGLYIKNIRFVTASNDIFISENKHYVTVIMRADYADGIVQLLEPDKCEEWQWFAWAELPFPLFLPIQSFIEKGFKL